MRQAAKQWKKNLGRLRRENREVRRANGILETASAFSQRVTRPSHDRVIFYFDAYKDQFGVEAIRRVLKKADREFVTSRGYRKATTRAGVSGRRVDAPRDDDQPEGTGSSPGPCTAKLPSTSTRKVLRSRHSLRSQPVGICLHRAYRGCLQPKNCLLCNTLYNAYRCAAIGGLGACVNDCKANSWKPADSPQRSGQLVRFTEVFHSFGRSRDPAKCGNSW